MLDVLQGSVAVAEVSRVYGAPPPDVKGRAKGCRKSVVNGLGSRALDLKEPYEKPIRELYQALVGQML